MATERNAPLKWYRNTGTVTKLRASAHETGIFRRLPTRLAAGIGTSLSRSWQVFIGRIVDLALRIKLGVERMPELSSIRLMPYSTEIRSLHLGIGTQERGALHPTDKYRNLASGFSEILHGSQVH